MIDPGLVKPRTAIYFKQYPTRFGVVWLDRATETVIVSFDDNLYKIRVKWVSNKPDFAIELSDAYKYVVDTGGDPNDEDYLLAPSDASEMPLMNYHEWLRLLSRLLRELADDGN